MKYGLIIQLPEFCTVHNREGKDQHHPWMNQKNSRCASTQSEVWLGQVCFSGCLPAQWQQREWKHMWKFKNAEFLRGKKTNNKATQVEWAGWSSGCSWTELHLLSFSSAALFSSLSCFLWNIVKKKDVVSAVMDLLNHKEGWPPESPFSYMTTINVVLFWAFFNACHPSLHSMSEPFSLWKTIFLSHYKDRILERLQLKLIIQADISKFCRSVSCIRLT